MWQTRVCVFVFVCSALTAHGARAALTCLSSSPSPASTRAVTFLGCRFYSQTAVDLPQTAATWGFLCAFAAVRARGWHLSAALPKWHGSSDGISRNVSHAAPVVVLKGSLPFCVVPPLPQQQRN